MPLFSVIVPMYNVEKYARQCIESILDQTYEDFELILVDDGAKDSTPQIIDEYARIDNRIVVIHKENGGLVSARKAGTLRACGKYIVPIDGDDWVHIKYLEKFAEIIQKYCDVDVVCCNFFDAFEDGTVKERFSKKSKFGLLDYNYLVNTLFYNMSSFPQSQWAKVYKRELYTKYQMQVADTITIGEDESVTYPLIYDAKLIYKMENCLYYYRANPTSMTKVRKEWSTQGLLDRVAHLEKVLKLESYNLETQFTAYVAHAVINQSLSYFKANSYFVARKKTRALLGDGLINKYISKSVEIKNKKEKIAKFALKNKLYILVKIYSLFW